jgi:autotransporter translocation and assembly factor TamB
VKKVIKFTLIAFIALFLFLIISVAAVLVYINTNHAAKLIQSNLNKAIPGSITWENHHLSVFKGTFEFNDIRIRTPDNEDVVSLEQLLLEVSMPSLLKKRVQVTGFALKNPIIDLETDSSGLLNIATVFIDLSDTIPEEKEDKKEDTDPFNVVIDNFNIDRAAFSFATNQVEKNILLKEINLSAKGNLLEQSANLDLSVQGITLSFGPVNFEFNDLNLSTALQKGRIKPLDLSVEGESSSIALQGLVDSVFNDPVLSVNLEIKTELEELLQNNLQLDQQYSGNTQVTLAVNGNVGNPDATMYVDYKGGRILENRLRGLQLDLSLSDRIAQIKKLNIMSPSGQLSLSGKADMQHVFENSFFDSLIDFDNFTYETEINISDFMLEELIWLTDVLKGEVDSKLSVSGKGVDYKKLSAKVALSLTTENLITAPPLNPIDGSADIKASMRDGIASLENLLVTVDKTNLKTTGRYNLLNNSLTASVMLDTAHLDVILPLVGVDSIGGKVTFNADIKGPASGLTGECTFNSKDIAFKGFTVGDISLSTILDNTGTATVPYLTIQNKKTNLHVEGSARLFAAGSLKPLKEPLYDIEIKKSVIYLEDFMDSLQAHADLSAQITGSLKNLDGFITLDVDSIDLGAQKLERITLSASLDSQRIFIQPLDIHITPQDSLTITGWISTEKEYDIALTSPAIKLNSLDAIDTSGNINGTVTIDITGKGFFDNPRAQGLVSIKDIYIQNNRFDDVNLNISLKDQLASVNGKLNFDLNGTYHLKKKQFNAAVQFDNTALMPYFNIAGQKDLNGTISGIINASGTTDSLNKTRSTVNISNLVIFHKDIEVAVISTQNLVGEFTGNSISLSPIHIALLTDGKLDLSGSGSIDGNLDFILEGDIPLSLVSLFTEDLPDAKGDLHITSSLKGTRLKPLLHADVELRNIGATVPVLMQELHSVNGRISATPEMITIHDINGKLDDGDFKCNGAVTLDSLKPSDITVTLNTQNLPVQVPEMCDVLLNSEITATGDLNNSVRCRGELVLLEGIYFQDIKFNPLTGVTEKKREVKPIDPVEDTASFLSKINLNIDIKNRQPFIIDNNLAVLELMPDLKIVGTAKRPLVNGRVKMNEGTVNYYLREFTVKKGILDFVNPYKIDPTIDINADTRVQDYTITLNVSGTIEDLTFQLSSEPSLEDEDILLLLIVGRTAGEIREGKVGSSGSTEQKLAQLVDATLGESLKKVAGLDILQINTKDSTGVTDEENERIEVTVGKALTKRLTTKVSVESLNGELTQHK